MSFPATTFDPARRLEVYFRIRRNGSKTFTFYDSDGAPYPISDKTFEFIVKTNSGDRTNQIRLTESDGISKTFNALVVTVDSDDTNIKEGEYYWELYISSTSKTWLSGKAFFHNGVFDGVGEESDEITIVDASNFIKQTTTDVPSASVLQLHTTNYEIIPAPGVGKYNKLISALHVLVYNSIAYTATNGPVIDFYYGSGRTFDAGLPTAGTFMTGSQNKVTSVTEAGGGLSSVNISDIENKAITARTTSDTAFWTLGNSVYRVIATYMVIDI